MLAGRGCYAKRLLHQTIGLVAVSLGLAVVQLVLAVAARLRASSVRAARRGAKPSASLALHLAVGKEASRHARCAPRLAVGPAAHAGFALVPYENGAGANRLPFLLRKATLDAGQEAEAACLKELDGVCWVPYVAVVRLHLFCRYGFHYDGIIAVLSCL